MKTKFVKSAGLSFNILKNMINSPKRLTLFGLMFITTYSFSQDKPVSSESWELKLAEVDSYIQSIDDKTMAINARIAGVPVENLDPSILVRLNDLQIQREQFVREKVSIEAMLNSASNFSPVIQITEIPLSTFITLPQLNQEQILAHPERFIVIESK